MIFYIPDHHDQKDFFLRAAWVIPRQQDKSSSQLDVDGFGMLGPIADYWFGVFQYWILPQQTERKLIYAKN